MTTCGHVVLGVSHTCNPSESQPLTQLHPLRWHRRRGESWTLLSNPVSGLTSFSSSQLPAALCPPCRAPATLRSTKPPRGAPGRTCPTRPRLRDHEFQTRNRIPGDSPRDDAVMEEAPQGSSGCSPGTTKDDVVVCREPQSDRGCDSHKSPRKAAGRRLRSVLHPLRSGRHPGEREETRGSSSAR